MTLHTFHLNDNLLKALNDQKVKYLVVGGLAVHHYCPERIVDDLDLLIEPTLENAEKVKDALKKIGMNVDELNVQGLTKEWKRLCLKKFLNADILTPGGGLDFNITFRNSIEVNVNGIPVRVMSCTDLLEHKHARIQYLTTNYPNKLDEIEKERSDVKLLEDKCN